MTPKQIKFARGILHSKGLSDSKDEIVLELTDGRTSHLSEMTKAEAQLFFDVMLGEAQSPAPNSEAAKCDNSTRKLLSMAHEVKWQSPNGKVDYQRLSNWCKKYSPAHKCYKQQNSKELAETVTSFSKLHIQTLRKL